MRFGAIFSSRLIRGRIASIAAATDMHAIAITCTAAVAAST
ncbi:hypothetical protein SAMCCGM7_pC1432 (plasmid) [Sinorhizobium americanum CCGM7]|nr:hypothetical protein SAMCCGM7_pC1432 [Sinorhizobium americanum CCGM7]